MALAASTVTCRIDKLINPDIADRLLVSPDSLRASANAGSRREDTVIVRIASADGATLPWNATTTASWLTLLHSSGAAPDSVVVILHPENLSQVLHQDAIVFTSVHAREPVQLPVIFDILPPAPELSIAPSSYATSALAGSAVPDTFMVGIDNTGALPLTWTAEVDQPWLTLLRDAGGAPPQDSAIVILTTNGLGAGVHEGTVTIAAPDAIGSPMTVTVSFTITPCAEQEIVPDVVVDGFIALSDCTAPRRPGSHARLFSISPDAGDTLSFRLTSPDFDAYLVLTDSFGTSLRQNDNCPAVTGPACILDFHVPTGGRYVVEATTASSGNTGAFSLVVIQEHAPTAPQSIGQFRGDSITSIGIGLPTTENVAVFKATVKDPNPRDSVRLEVEVVETSSPFSATPNHASDFVPVGQSAWIRVPALIENAGYHWRARTCDKTLRCSAWLDFGGNPDAAADLLINAVQENPALDGGSLGQFNGMTAIAVGGGTGGGLGSTQTVTFTGLVTDADPGDNILLEVEAKATTAAFNGTSGLPPGTAVTSGTTASATAGYSVGLLAANYHWRARACDQTSRCSGWIPFGNGNSDVVGPLNPADTDFHVP